MNLDSTYVWMWTVDALMCLQEVKDIGRSCISFWEMKSTKKLWVCSFENMQLKRPIPSSTQPGNPPTPPAAGSNVFSFNSFK